MSTAISDIYDIFQGAIEHARSLGFTSGEIEEAVSGLTGEIDIDIPTPFDDDESEDIAVPVGMRDDPKGEIYWAGMRHGYRDCCIAFFAEVWIEQNPGTEFRLAYSARMDAVGACFAPCPACLMRLEKLAGIPVAVTAGQEATA